MFKKKQHKTSPPVQTSFMSKIRGWFFTGLLVTTPILLTIYIIWLFVGFIDRQVTSLIPSFLHDYFTLEFIGQIPGLGLLIGVITITCIGALAAGFFGRWLIRTGENILNRMPVVRSIYGASKQILETILSAQSDAFRDVVLVEYPRKSLWVIGFVTGGSKGEVKDKIAGKTVSVFIPTTPNPTSGFLLFCPIAQLVYLDMSVEDAVKLVVSGGIATPKYQKTKQNSVTSPGKNAKTLKSSRPKN